MGTTRKILATLLLIGVVGASAGFATFSSFSATTSNTGNTFSTGSVVLGDNDAGSPMYTVSGAALGSTTVRCIEITYTGSLPADVHMYLPTTLDAAAGYIDLTIEKGTGNAAFPGCAGFVSQSTIYTGTLGAFASAHSDWATGVNAYPGSQTEWDQNDTLVYRLTLTVQNTANAEGRTIGSHDFVWEAQNQ